MELPGIIFLPFSVKKKLHLRFFTRSKMHLCLGCQVLNIPGIIVVLWDNDNAIFSYFILPQLYYRNGYSYILEMFMNNMANMEKWSNG